MHIFVAVTIGFLFGVVLASIYHTRIDSAVAALRREKAVLEADVNNWKNEALATREKLVSFFEEAEAAKARLAELEGNIRASILAKSAALENKL